MEKKFICQVNELSGKKTIIKYYEEIRDELILLKNTEGKISFLLGENLDYFFRR